MNSATPLSTLDGDSVAAIDDGFAVTNLRDAVTVAIRRYLQELDGQMTTDVYRMVLAEVEPPLLEEIMAYTRDNQTRASHMLGLNRGTLRKKLKQYGLTSERG